MQKHDQICFNEKVEICATHDFYDACASMNRTIKIVSFNFSFVLRAACKYELALRPAEFAKSVIHQKTTREWPRPEMDKTANRLARE